MKMIEITPACGACIETVAKEMLLTRAKLGEQVSVVFNGVTVTTENCLSAEDIVSQYNVKSSKRREEWLASPEGIAYTQKRKAVRQHLQNEADICMKLLETLDMNSDVDVIDWLLRLRDPSDHIEVAIDKAKIIKRFKENGFKSNVNCGADFNAEDRRNSFEYLVGQALYGLIQVGAIHQVFHRFADEWKTKFVSK